eukprot:5935891-Amphidinium_carterae.1
MVCNYEHVVPHDIASISVVAVLDCFEVYDSLRAEGKCLAAYTIHLPQVTPYIYLLWKRPT